MIAAAARSRIRNAWVTGLLGVLTLIGAIALMAYAAPGRARGQELPVRAHGGSAVAAALIQRPPAPRFPAPWGRGGALAGHARRGAAHHARVIHGRPR